MPPPNVCGSAESDLGIVRLWHERRLVEHAGVGLAQETAPVRRLYGAFAEPITKVLRVPVVRPVLIISPQRERAVEAEAVPGVA